MDILKVDQVGRRKMVLTIANAIEFIKSGQFLTNPSLINKCEINWGYGSQDGRIKDVFLSVKNGEPVKVPECESGIYHGPDFGSVVVSRYRHSEPEGRRMDIVFVPV